MRWLLDDAIAAFNDRDVAGATRPLAHGWRDRASGVDLGALTTALNYALLMRRRDFRLELDPDSFRFEANDENAAEVTFELSLSRTRVLWKLRVDARLERVQGEWGIVGSTHETLSGRRPSF